MCMHVATDRPALSARMGHAAVIMHNTLVVIGGRHGPSHALGDVWTCDLEAAMQAGHVQWVARGGGLPPRHRHTAALDEVWCRTAVCMG